jgi:hypothetical protein
MSFWILQELHKESDVFGSPPVVKNDETFLAKPGRLMI